MFSLIWFISRFNEGGLKEVNFLVTTVLCTVNTSLVLTSLLYFKTLLMSAGLIAKENWSFFITDVIFATIKFCLLIAFLEIMTTGLFFDFDRSVYGYYVVIYIYTNI